MNKLTLLWEAPLALVSFLIHRTTRFTLAILIALREARNRDKQKTWRVMSGDLLKGPVVLARIMTEAPRWNPHAVIAQCGPVSASSFRIDRTSMTESAEYWSLICYRFPEKTVQAMLDSIVVDQTGECIELQTPPGQYIFALRYYRFAETITFPRVEADGSIVVPRLTVTSSVNDFYHDLHRRQRLFHLFLQYYAYVLLKYQDIAPAERVKREFLPAGNPGTLFYYGLTPKNTCLQIEVPANLLVTHEASVTQYSIASFPLTWRHLVEKTIMPPRARDTSYLVRIQAVKPGRVLKRDEVRISLVPDRLFVRVQPSQELGDS